jgi:hypothetical protein
MFFDSPRLAVTSSCVLRLLFEGAACWSIGTAVRWSRLKDLQKQQTSRRLSRTTTRCFLANWKILKECWKQQAFALPEGVGVADLG